MSGLPHRGRRGFVTVGQDAAMPRMSRLRLDGTLWYRGWRGCHHPDRPRGDGVIAKWLAAVGDPHRPVKMILHEHRLGVDLRLDLKQLAVVGHANRAR